MTSIEDRLAAMATAVTPPDLPAAGVVMRRGRRRRHRRRAAGLAALAALGTSGVAVAALRPDGREAVVTTAPGDGGPSVPSTGARPDATPGAPGTLLVPDVVGLTVGDARRALESIGLTAAAPTNSEGGQVVSQGPGPGATLRIGSPVTLAVADLDRPAGVEGPVARGELLDGRAWTVGRSPDHGLCVTLGASDLGCDDIGPAIPPGADPATPRVAADGTGSAHPADEAGALALGHLPPGADTVALLHDDGRTVTDGLVVEPAGRVWGMPLQPGDNPDTVVYRAASGQEVARFPIG